MEAGELCANFIYIEPFLQISAIQRHHHHNCNSPQLKKNSNSEKKELVPSLVSFLHKQKSDGFHKLRLTEKKRVNFTHFRSRAKVSIRERDKLDLLTDYRSDITFSFFPEQTPRRNGAWGTLCIEPNPLKELNHQPLQSLKDSFIIEIINKVFKSRTPPPPPDAQTHTF